MSYSKYRAKATHLDGHRFASKAESIRYSELKNLERAGLISKLKLQPEFAIAINGKHCFKYLADFEYIQNGERVVEDVKSSFTAKLDLYRLKKKCVEAAYNITIQEVGIKPKRKGRDVSAEVAQIFREAAVKHK